MAEVNLDPSAIVKLHLIAQNAQHEVVEEVADDARQYAPVDTGELRGSIHVEGDTVRVGTDHWAPTEFGAQPHVIEPEQKEALYWAGAAHPVDRVNHPGNDPQPFMRPALYKKRRI